MENLDDMECLTLRFFGKWSGNWRWKAKKVRVQDLSPFEMRIWFMS